MSVKSKAAGAAVLAVAPEAELAEGAAGAAGAGKAAAGKTAGRGAVSDPRVSAPGSKAARQRQDVEDIKARRQAREDIANNPRVEPGDGPGAGPAPASPGAGPSLPQFMTDQTGSPSWWPSGAGAQAAANTGGGFLLGLIAWAAALAYLRGGMPEVRKLAAAKFLNKTGGGG